jgi:TorA maturation chaperone TorD
MNPSPCPAKFSSSLHKSFKNISVIYRFLAQSMKYPETSWFSEDFTRSFLSLLNALGGTEEQAILQEHFSNSDNVIEDLQIEYTRLFINGVPHVAAPPYASVYLDKSLQGAFTAEILAFYHDKGCAMADNSDLPDHIVHELEFLSHLVEDGDLNGERDFLQRFFLKWFPLFRDRVLKEAHHPYYRMVITMIDYFTKEEE